VEEGKVFLAEETAYAKNKPRNKRNHDIFKNQKLVNRTGVLTARMGMEENKANDHKEFLIPP
jgi:hypothetical protein